MSILIMIVLLSILILVHEAGHYFAARMFGIRVDKFGFGMPIGPTLFEKKVGDLTILVHAFLLGGYVSFPDDEKESDLPKNSMERFSNRPIYQRMVVISAGVISNVICAFVLVLLTAFLWGNIPAGKYDLYINKITAEKNAPVWNSGLQAGDRIIDINGTPADTPAALLVFAQSGKQFDGKADITLINKNYQNLKKINPAFTENENIPAGVLVKLPATTYEKPLNITKNQIMGLEKIKDNQQVLNERQKTLTKKIYGKKYYESDGETSLHDLAYALSDNIRPLHITVERNGKKVALKPVYADKNGKIGVEFNTKEVLEKVKGPKSAVSLSAKYLTDQTYYLLYGLKQIFTGQIPFKDLHGIVAVTKIGGDTIKQGHDGIFYGLLLTAIISMDLAIINFLPIPALDGGHFMFLIIEKLRGRPIEEETLNIIGNIFFTLLIVLMILIVFNDVYGLITHKF